MVPFAGHGIKSQYWFRAKRYGWGWGLPLRWQGWAVLGAFAVFLVLGIALFSPATRPVLYAIYVAVLSAALVGVGYLKGEPPK